MVFSSQIFVFYFLPAVLVLYYTCPPRFRALLLTGLSYLFYGWANPLFVLLMLSSTLIDYCCGLYLGWHPHLPGQPQPRPRKVALLISIVANLSLLGFFKYFNFAIENYRALVEWLGVGGLGIETALRVTLPLGISFYTFQSMSYTIDVYRDRVRPLRNFITFAAYVSMFPQLVAGPILRFNEVAAQLRERSHTLTKFVRGVSLFCLGLGKKVLLANPCGKVADLAFNAGSLETSDAWFGALAYAFQIYFDFSAYSDMAIGLGLMLGFVFPKNFDSPYWSASITEFWRRWHISLSTWLRDYLYFPLGGNRKGPLRTYVNLALVMLLGGLWHGASWNFLVWGGIHGLMLAFERALGKDSIYARLPKPFRVLITFVIVTFGWVFFRAPDLPSALQYCGSMLGLVDPNAGARLLDGILYQPYYVLVMGIAAAFVWTCPQTWTWTRSISWPKAAWILAVFWAALAMLTTQSFNPFIYFIF
jgi:alginate O-acetyltransferase complex protein AlgI